MFLFDLDKANKAFVQKSIDDIAGVGYSPDEVEVIKDDLDYYCRLVTEGSFLNPWYASDIGNLLFMLLVLIQVMDKEQRAEVMARFLETIKENVEYVDLVKGIPNVK